MQLPPDLKPPTAPWYKIQNLPADEERAGEAFRDYVHEVARSGADFVASIALFSLCCNHLPGSSLGSNWKFIAARNGAMALRNYAETLSAARSLIGKIPSWAGQIDAKALKQIQKAFAQRFPRIEKLRHAVAHPEFYADPNIDMTSAAPITTAGFEVGEGAQVKNVLDGETYLSTINGIHVQYDLSEANVRFVNDQTSAVLAALEQLPH